MLRFEIKQFRMVVLGRDYKMPLRAKHASVIGAGSITAWEKRPGACPHDDAPSLPAIPPTTHPGSAGRYGRFQQPQAELLPGREIAGNGICSLG